MLAPRHTFPFPSPTLQERGPVIHAAASCGALPRDVETSGTSDKITIQNASLGQSRHDKLAVWLAFSLKEMREKYSQETGQLVPWWENVNLDVNCRGGGSSSSSCEGFISQLPLCHLPAIEEQFTPAEESKNREEDGSEKCQGHCLISSGGQTHDRALCFIYVTTAMFKIHSAVCGKPKGPQSTCCPRAHHPQEPKPGKYTRPRGLSWGLNNIFWIKRKKGWKGPCLLLKDQNYNFKRTNKGELS